MMLLLLNTIVTAIIVAIIAAAISTVTSTMIADIGAPGIVPIVFLKGSLSRVY